MEVEKILPWFPADWNGPSHGARPSRSLLHGLPVSFRCVLRRWGRLPGLCAGGVQVSMLR